MPLKELIDRFLNKLSSIYSDSVTYCSIVLYMRRCFMFVATGWVSHLAVEWLEDESHRCTLIVVWESNAIWTSSSTPSRLRRQQILSQIHATFPAVGQPACRAGRALEGSEGRTRRSPDQVVCSTDYSASSSLAPIHYS